MVARSPEGPAAAELARDAVRSPREQSRTGAVNLQQVELHVQDGIDVESLAANAAKGASVRSGSTRLITAAERDGKKRRESELEAALTCNIQSGQELDRACSMAGNSGP